jgi:hypothetical protein
VEQADAEDIVVPFHEAPWACHRIDEHRPDRSVRGVARQPHPGQRRRKTRGFEMPAERANATTNPGHASPADPVAKIASIALRAPRAAHGEDHRVESACQHDAAGVSVREKTARDVPLVI